MQDVAVITQVNGKLREKLSFWRDELEASAFVFDVIEHGYVLPLKSEPTQYVGGNHTLWEKVLKS